MPETNRVTLTAENLQRPILEVRLLGGFDVHINGKPLPSLRSRREQWLLALLVLRQDRDTARDWMATTLWPDNDEPQALFYLRKSLSNLRQALGAEAIRLLAPTPRTVRLDLSNAFADVVAFDRALKQATGSADSAASLQEAVDLYRGPLLPGCLEEWASGERNQREQAYLGALETLATHFYARGEPATTVHWLRLLLAADPYRESAYDFLMKALADCGDMAAITVVYQELRSRLRQDLNAAPSPETEALYRQLKQQDKPIAAVPSQPLDRPEMRRHLPVPLSALIGRENEIPEILNWLKRQRLVTLVGTGGVGKTRLAIAVADAALPRFEQGVWFVDLAAVSDPTLVPHVTAIALRIAEEQGRPLTETLTETLATHSMLLVLDNCEHLLEACAEFVYCLLSTCPALCILATSRQPLSVMGEQVYRVPSLQLPPLDLHAQDAEATLQEKDPHFLMEYEAIRLFMDRANRVNTTFRLSRRNAMDIVDICRQLDGIPLAIEMAATRLGSLSVGEIKTRLAERFRLLTSGNRGVLPRQQTLRAAIDWSYDQLSEAERVLLRRLSVFTGGWTSEAAECVCAGAEEAPASSASPVPVDFSDLLASLVDKSLAFRQEGANQEEAEAAIRYGMLETIRQYSLERLQASGERIEHRRRHRDYFLTLVEAGRRKLAGPERANWLAALEGEHGNLRQALAYCQEDPDSGEQGLRLGTALWGFWLARGYLSEGRAHFTSLLSHPGAQVRTKARADALNGAGVLAFQQSDFAVACGLHEEGLAICRELGESRSAAMALGNLGNVAATQGDYALARVAYEEGLVTCRELGDKGLLGSILNNLGNVAKEQGDYASARALHEESLAIEREAGHKAGIAHSLNNLGILAEVKEEYAVARALFEESLEIHRELGPPTAEAGNLASLGNVAFYQGHYLLARALYEESLVIRQKVGDSWGIAISLQGLGATASQMGDYLAARSLYEESLEIRQKVGDQLGIVELLQSLAALDLHDRHYERAARLWGAMSTMQDAIGSVLSPRKREQLEGELAAAREGMGEDVFQAAWERGCTMTLDQAIQYAREGARS